MPGRAIWRRAAEEDLTKAYLHIGYDSPGAADRFVQAVGDAVQLLLENPSAGRPRELRSHRAQGIRSWAPSSFPNHLIFYKSDGDDIEIIRLLYSARDIPSIFEQEK